MITTGLFSGKTILKLSISALIITFLFSNCKTGKKGEIEETDTTYIEDEEVVKNVEKVFYTLPSPFELSQMLRRAGAKYIYDILNDVQNTDKYNTEKSKALNLGVYGADLSYATIYGQTQEIMLFLQCSKKLSDELGITTSFKRNLVDRVEKNIDNKDSLLQIISDSYYDTDEFLKQNERPVTAVLVLVGGWLEGLYIATQLAQIIPEPDNAEIIQRIAEQKYPLNNVVALMEHYKNDPNITELLAEVTQLKDIYDKVEMITVSEIPKNIVNVDEKSTTIGTETKLNLTKEQLEQITLKIKEIRTKIIE